jgi:hypothetical protein
MFELQAVALRVVISSARARHSLFRLPPIKCVLLYRRFFKIP